jgi:predicted dehydrogenase
MNKKTKVGVFGAARGMSMIQVLAHHPDAELVAVCDRYEPLLHKCRDMADKIGLPLTYYTDFDLFFNHDMDAVVLANYANEHAPFAVRLLRSGRHVLSEVLPMETMAQAVDLVEAVESSGKVYAYAENYCYMLGTAEMKRRYRSGDIGEFRHGEGEYVHDCSSIWPDITYGERTHWRNNYYSTFYCTHSLGPILTITGTRPVKVVGFETPNAPYMSEVGAGAGISGMEIMQMSNGATVKSLHGHLRREPPSIWFSVYGDEGMMETDRWGEGVGRINLFQTNSPLTSLQQSYAPKPRLPESLIKPGHGHGGGDFYTVHYFMEKILGRENGNESIDVYQALDMAIPGLLAYRSICNGNTPQEVPDFRIPAQREPYRSDNWSTNIANVGRDRAPLCTFGSPEIPDSVYEAVRAKWLKSQANQ